jgi:hypothetical protein
MRVLIPAAMISDFTSRSATPFTPQTRAQVATATLRQAGRLNKDRRRTGDG